MNKTSYAKDFKCCKCKKKQADVWWPYMDVDVPHAPYCRKCVDKMKMEILMKVYETELHLGSVFTFNNFKNETNNTKKDD